MRASKSFFAPFGFRDRGAASVADDAVRPGLLGRAEALPPIIARPNTRKDRTAVRRLTRAVTLQECLLSLLLPFAVPTAAAGVFSLVQNFPSIYAILFPSVVVLVGNHRERSWRH